MTDNSRRGLAAQALLLARPILRDLLLSDVECCAVIRDGAPDLTTLTAVDKAWLRPTINAIRAIDAATQLKTHEPAETRWLNELIENGLPDDGSRNADEGKRQ